MDQTIRITKKRSPRRRIPLQRTSLPRHATRAASALSGAPSELTEEALHLGIVAHEAATCATPMTMQLELLLSQRFGALDPRQERALRVMEKSMDRLTVLLKDVADLSRLESGMIHLEQRETDLVRLVDQIVVACTPAAERAEVTLVHEVASPAPLVADPDRLLQVITNLVTNAIKFTPAGGEVVVSTGSRGDHVEMHVRDSGRGLDPEQMVQLFEPFVRFHGGNGRQPGSGLGLYIARGIVAAHDGTIDVTSPGIGHGSTFTVRLPSRPRWHEAADGGR